MVDVLTRRLWLSLLLLFAVYYCFPGTSPCLAAVLKDIRVGEYDTFTRVVFEFDTPETINDPIMDLGEARIQIGFPQTQPQFVRRIQLPGATHVKDIQIITDQTGLSAVILLSAPYSRTDSFNLDAPVRKVLDIYWGNNSAPAVPLIAPPAPSSPLEGNLPEIGLDGGAAVQQNQVTAPAPVNSLQPASEAPPPDVEAVARPLPPHLPQLQDQQPIHLRNGPPPEPSLPRLLKQTSSADTALSARPADTAARSNWLQYYLVIVLVVLTIIILILLIMMLLNRSRWEVERLPMSTHDFLNYQDDQIAILNARIQEQLKRYDDA